jgi:hypothetical protein
VEEILENFKNGKFLVSNQVTLTLFNHQGKIINPLFWSIICPSTS